MKKIICILMVAMLTLSLGVTVFAAKEGCPETGCTGELKEWTEVKVTYVTCKQTGDESMQDEKVTTYYYCECNKCDYHENYSKVVTHCPH